MSSKELNRFRRFSRARQTRRAPTDALFARKTCAPGLLNAVFVVLPGRKKAHMGARCGIKIVAP